MNPPKWITSALVFLGWAQILAMIVQCCELVKIQITVGILPKSESTLVSSLDGTLWNSAIQSIIQGFAFGFLLIGIARLIVVMENRGEQR